MFRGFPGGSGSKESACNAGDLGSIPESGRPLGEGNGNPLQYACLENPMDREACPFSSIVDVKIAIKSFASYMVFSFPTLCLLKKNKFYGICFLIIIKRCC